MFPMFPMLLVLLVLPMFPMLLTCWIFTVAPRVDARRRVAARAFVDLGAR
ncbi:hypothetical protein [Streptomyces sp. NPDC020607]